MSFEEKYSIRSDYIQAPSKRRSGLLIGSAVRFVVAHDTGNPGSTAAANVRYYQNSRNDMSASAHLFVDDREIVECVPALTTDKPEKAWHVLYDLPTDNRLFGCNANDAAIGVEYCYGGRIDADEAYRRYVWVLARICDRYHLDPASSIVGHFFLDPTRRTDPVTGLAASRRTYEQCLRDVAAEFTACGGVTVPVSAPASLADAEATTTVRLNLRRAPNTRAEVVRTVPPGTVLRLSGTLEHGEPVNGIDLWYVDREGHYLWSGGVTVGA
jgi:N-acetylmuramoyl-L-alanine amidase